MTLWGGEDAVGLCSSDGERTGDGCEFIFVDEAWVGEVANVDAVLIMTNDILKVLA
jgi:hypothetical protein